MLCMWNVVFWCCGLVMMMFLDAGWTSLTDAFAGWESCGRSGEMFLDHVTWASRCLSHACVYLKGLSTS